MAKPDKDLESFTVVDSTETITPTNKNTSDISKTDDEIPATDEVTKPSNADSLNDSPEPTPEITPEPPVEESPQPIKTESHPDKPKRSFSKKKLAIIVALVLIIGGAVAAYLLVFKKDKSTSTKAPQAETTPAADENSDTKDLRGKDYAIDGRTWLAEYQKVDGYTYFTNLTNVDPAYVIYYKVGTVDGKDLIAVSVPISEPSYPANSLFIAESKTKATLLKKHSPDLYLDDKYYGPDLASGVTTDSTTEFPEIAGQSSLTYDTAKFSVTSTIGTPITGRSMAFDDKVSQQSDIDTSKLPVEKFLTSNKFGHLFRESSKAKPTYEFQTYVLQTWDSRKVGYQIKNDASEPKADTITFKDGKKSDVDYGTFSTGCGTGIQYTIMTTEPKNLTEVAKGPNGTAYYTMYSKSDTSDALLKDFYEEYKTYDDSTLNKGLSFDDFVSKTPILLYRNELKQLTAIYRVDLAPSFGCGKPVVYLYPTSPTEVKVSVEADVVVSEPAYNNGWTAFAQPNGNLTVNGKGYDSLFWEGYGHGIYPDVSTQGVVVKQPDLKNTLSTHMTALGLNAKEQRDFMAFWSSKLPTDPYVKLTWLGTGDMDRLAPLHISPAPDTRIRVFLDAKGLSSPVKLQPQRFSAPVRKGFTVVEWGGLINGKLQ